MQVPLELVLYQSSQDMLLDMQAEPLLNQKRTTYSVIYKKC